MRKKKIKITAEAIEINDMHIKTLLVTDYPEDSYAGILGMVTNGDHVNRGVIINFALHFRPSTLRFNTEMNNRLRRLQRNIDSMNTGQITDTVRKEEVKTLKSLLYLRDHADRYIDVWLTITFSSADKKLLDLSIENFIDNVEFKGWKLSPLPKEQHEALKSAWMGSDDSKIFLQYPGRVMDMNAIAALYPFLSGSISDSTGCYVGHRLSDCTAVHKDFTLTPDNQTMIVVGSSDSGKSTFLKGLIPSLLAQGFKVYVYDVDGEYYNSCRELGGVWVDYTAGSGFYIDPTIIESPISEEIDINQLDDSSRERALESDVARYNEAVANTRALISLLSKDFNVKKKNALGKALVQMWEEAGILKPDPSTWSIRSEEVGLKPLYFRIKNNGKTDIGARELAEDMWTFFEGPDSDMFLKADSGEWIKDANFIVFHVASSADNDIDQEMGAIKIVSTTHMTWQQIKRDRIKKQHYSVEIYDEWQRLRKNPHARAPVYRSVTTGRKFNDQAILAFNDPSVIFTEDGGEGMWNNSKYKILFSLEENFIRKIADASNMPKEVLNQWLNLHKYSFIYRERANGRDIYDVLRMELPRSEIDKLSKTRGLS